MLHVFEYLHGCAVQSTGLYNGNVSSVLVRVMKEEWRNDDFSEKDSNPLDVSTTEERETKTDATGAKASLFRSRECLAKSADS